MSTNMILSKKVGKSSNDIFFKSIPLKDSCVINFYTRLPNGGHFLSKFGVL